MCNARFIMYAIGQKVVIASFTNVTGTFQILYLYLCNEIHSTMHTRIVCLQYLLYYVLIYFYIAQMNILQINLSQCE